MQRLATVFVCGLVLLGAVTIVGSANAEPVDNNAQQCHRNDDVGWATHGECVSTQTPQSICRSIEESLLYPYSMQIYVRGQDNVAVPARSPALVERFGDCVGAFGPYYIDWVAIGATPVSS